jgi:uncharacterized membrane protein YbhN (UPF0104 family)
VGIARWTLVAFALAAFAHTLRGAELGRAVSLVKAIGAPVVLVAVPYLVAMALQATAYTRIVDRVRANAAQRSRAAGRLGLGLRVLSVLLSTEAVLMSVPGGPALSETLNPYLLKRRCGVPLPEGVAAVAARKSLIVFTNALYVLIAVVAGGAYLRSASRALIGAPGLEWVVVVTGLMMAAGAFGLSRLLLSGSIAARAHGLLLRIPSERVRRWLSDRRGSFVETDAHFASVWSGHWTETAASGALFLANWLVEGAEALVILRLLGVEISYAEVLAFEVVVSLLRSIAFMIPAGLGVQDAGYVAFLGAFGVPDAATLGVAFVMIKRAKELFWIALGFALFLVLGDGPPPAPATPLPERA